VVVLLPHTGPEEASGIVRRITGVLAARDPEPAYGEIHARVLALGGDAEDARGLIDRLAETGPLREVVAGRGTP
jgi:hypothetical protein